MTELVRDYNLAIQYTLATKEMAAKLIRECFSESQLEEMLRPEVDALGHEASQKLIGEVNAGFRTKYEARAEISDNVADKRSLFQWMNGMKLRKKHS